MNSQLTTLEQLQTNLHSPDYDHLLRLSTAGHLGEWIPEWQRLIGPRNIQHHTHYYSLDQHTLWVADKTGRSPHFRNLNPDQQFFIILSALLHDIDKNTGPERLRGKIPVDKLHPIKSAEHIRTILPRLGCSTEFTQRMYSVIHHHQAFGRLFIIYGHDAPQEAFDAIVLKIRSNALLECLLALSEGDIRAVRMGDEYFTPEVADSLPRYGGYVRNRINTFRVRQGAFPQKLTVTQEGKLNLAQSAGFFIPVDSQVELFEVLSSLAWGGATAYPYASNLDCLEACTGALLIRFLPENLAYWGPTPNGFPKGSHSLPMTFFYNLILGNRVRYPLVPPYDDLFDQVLACQHHMADCLASWPDEGDWLQAFDAFEQSTYGATTTLLGDHQTPAVCLDHVGFAPTPWMGIGTRPIVSGLYWCEEQNPLRMSPWHQLPFFPN